MNDEERTDAISEFYLDLALSQVQPAPVINATGLCLFCDEPLPDGQRWCDADCRDDWEKEQKYDRL